MPPGKPRSKLAREQPKKIESQCSALTRSYNACKNRASILRGRPRRLPVCWPHRKLGLAVAFCQAVLGDNRKCLKKIPWTEIQLCFEHIDFALPCYILRLPTELRQLIFSYILDEYQSSYAKFYTYYSFLKVARLNRQIFQETTDLLYRTFVCDIFVHDKDVQILGRKCRSIQPGSWQKFKRITLNFNISDDIYGQHRPILENIQLIASHLRGSNLIRLHVCLDSYLFWYNDSRFAELLRSSLPLYLDAFGQLGRVTEPSVTITPMSGRLSEIELWMKSTSNDAKAMAIAMEWRRYYEEWAENLKRES
ncbi:hypothetical protein ACJ73_04780 [Blastomyces percursus]|uniref:F-box domain-containing protein n=1 Tax=Blastomyces percursus TaxID=1658174 RepID=A0A1J9Q583_9EURO|nr:hypothetical protein ACJ73_04780 [Blastomyces percursus]